MLVAFGVFQAKDETFFTGGSCPHPQKLTALMSLFFLRPCAENLKKFELGTFVRRNGIEKGIKTGLKQVRLCWDIGKYPAILKKPPLVPQPLFQRHTLAPVR